MKATIWHNPKCGTSRKTLALLEEAGADVTVVEYLKTPPAAAALADLYARASLTPREGLRVREPAARLLIDTGASDTDILAAMVADPILIERPLVETERGVRLCRPQERVSEIL
ncbi:arsenate reductase (glutaredoxin) [Sphingomonas solaris]|uniref:Arsenate reductase n=1 Tax=Alterirhizorhabdus solaris TaxID=2529389 RepID=A0A558R2Y0_9SPHN|nr:arsenate reductase (glutaredoxin) [Sphingomonas solaris]TVV73702.1 arsenate reductase (glutaredoxin) [Sphingomonas solaris]